MLEKDIFLFDFIFFKHGENIFFVKKKVLEERIKKNKILENKVLMRYEDLLKKCSNREEERCMLCQCETEQGEYVIKMCKNFHFICFDCRKNFVGEIEVCFLCKEPAEYDLLNAISSNYQDFIRSSLIVSGKEPSFFLIEKHVNFILRKTIFSEKRILFLLEKFSIHIQIQKDVLVFSEDIFDMKANEDRFSEVVSCLKDPKTIRKGVFDYKKIENKYLWLKIDFKIFITFKQNSMFSIINFLEIERFPYNCFEEGYSGFIEWLIIKENCNVNDYDKFTEYIKQFYPIREIVFFFSKDISMLFNLSKIEGNDSKTYIVLRNIDLLILNTENRLNFPKNTFFYSEKTDCYDVDYLFKEIESFYLIDRANCFFLDGLLKENNIISFVCFIEREIETCYLEKFFMFFQKIDLYCNKKKYIQSIIENREFICTEKVKELYLREYSLNLLSNLKVSKESCGIVLFIESLSEECVLDFLKKKNRSFVIKKEIVKLVFYSYAIEILPKIRILEENCLECLEFYEENKRTKKLLDGYEENSIVFGKTKILVLWYYAIEMIRKLCFSQFSNLSLKLFYFEKDLKSIFDFNKKIFISNVKEISLSLDSFDLIQIIETESKFSLVLYIYDLSCLDNKKEMFFRLKSFIEKKTDMFTISLFNNIFVKMDGFDYMKTL